MAKKLILVDGSSVLSTSFFGNLPREYYKTGDTTNIMKTSSGQFTNGVYTMTKILLNIIKKQKPTHLAIAWDVSRNTFRKKVYEQYKSQRKETKPELSEQFKTAQNIFTKMGVLNLKLEGFEADDIIGTLSRKFENEIPVYILTKDQDALQLISEHTYVWLNTSKAKKMYQKRGIDEKQLQIPDGHFEFTPTTFQEEWGIRPIQMIDLKALEGDLSDNIPGVKGVGPSAAIPLLREYGTIETLYEAIETEDEKKLKQYFKESLGIKRSPIKSLIEGKEKAFLSKQLATIKRDIPEYENLTLDDLQFKLQKDATKEVFKELEFNSLMDKL